MTYFIIGVVGAIMLTTSVIYFSSKQDVISYVADKYTIYFSTSDISVDAFGGVSFSLKVSKSDKEVAWKIYTQIKTRIAAVEFDEIHDSLLLSNKSLYEVFSLVREEISSIPLARIRKSRDDKVVEFYLNILNKGIRPYLTKWHISISKWVENEQKKHPGKSILEIEKSFPQRKEVLKDIKSMNEKMEKISTELLKIVKS